MAEYRPKHRGLERVLGTGALFSTAYGNVGSSIYYALGLVAIYAAGMTPVVFVIAGLIFAATAATYAEATTMFPEAGGSSSFARRAFNEFWSFFAAWGQMLTYIITIAISAFFVPHYLGVFWDPLSESPADIVAGIVVVVLLGALNIVGVKESAGVNIGFAVADFLTQVVLVAVGLVLVFDPDLLVRQIDLGTTPTVGDFLIAIPVAMVAYTGIETISNMAEEARDYGKTIPRGIGLVVGAVAVIYTFLPAVALSAMPVKNGETVLALPKEQGGYADDPVLGVVENMHLGSLQHAAEIYVGILAASILFIATNAGILGVSRLSYSMGQHRQLPEFLRLLHPRFRTPYIAIAVFSAVACVAIVPGKADFLGVIYAFGAMLSFTMAHAAVVTLRVKHPDFDRPWKGPLNVRFRDRELPLFAILGGLGTGIALIVATVLDLRVLVSGVGWMVAGVLLYVGYRRRQGLALTETHKIVSPKPAVEHEVEYESILVAFEDNDYSAEAVSTAVRLAARRRRGIHVLVTITVPTNAPIDASMPEQEAKASSVIDSARVRGGRRVTGHWEKVRPGQAGRRVVEEAKEIRARAVVMPLPPRRTGASIFGRTLETVLNERPCRVIIDSSRDVR
ncbi:MAG: basic amino acid/polyamine antiporter, family [Thermoleophilaceae bacterium]|jgi:APA family basic amino acid/polyamine antiporter|nr:basic amino acid/polyamine antiporter, family [Thermoleophilaceae bacterium]MEA2407007.1 basic amino acid/polyamine antiporter, family [Thermoleophilaceae bacterium]